MTTELEKQFFQCFGIDPKKTITCDIEEDWLNDYHLKTWYPISDWMKYNAPCKGEKECSDKCNCYQVKNEYPQITDRHYLELILISSETDIVSICYDTVEHFKEGILECFIEYGEELKHQVQAIFKGER